MNASKQTSEPKDSVTLLREYAAIRIFHPDTFTRARTLMRNCADEIEGLRNVTYVTQQDWDRAQTALRAALEYVKAHTPPSSTAGTDIDMQRLIENALNG